MVRRSYGMRWGCCSKFFDECAYKIYFLVPFCKNFFVLETLLGFAPLYPTKLLLHLFAKRNVPFSFIPGFCEFTTSMNQG